MFTPPVTYHKEFTITDDYGLIAAGKPCPGCTAVAVQDRGRREPKMDADKIIAVIEREAKKGVNLFTLMGGEPLTVKGIHKVISYIDNSPFIDALVYTASYGLVNDKGGLTSAFARLQAAGLMKLYLLASVDKLILNKKDILPNDSSSFKAFYGLKLMETLAKKGYKDIAIHQTLRKDNLDHTLLLYQWASERGILFSCCPLVWKPYTSRRRDPVPFKNFADKLTKKDKPKLREIINRLITIETKRLKEKKPRSLIPSSAFLRLISDYGPDNLISCKKHRKVRPIFGRDITPDGKERWCIAQDTYNDAMLCGGCYYIGLDRGTPGEYWSFEGLTGQLGPNDLRWQNYIVCRKVPGFDPTRKNLIFYQKSPTERRDFPQAFIQ